LTWRTLGESQIQVGDKAPDAMHRVGDEGRSRWRDVTSRQAEPQAFTAVVGAGESVGMAEISDEMNHGRRFLLTALAEVAAPLDGIYSQRA